MTHCSRFLQFKPCLSRISTMRVIALQHRPSHSIILRRCHANLQRARYLTAKHGGHRPPVRRYRVPGHGLLLARSRRRPGPYSPPRSRLRCIGVTGRIWHYPAPISIVEGGPVRSDPGDTAECASYASQQSHGSRKRVSRRGALLPSAGRSGKPPRRRSCRFSLRQRPRPFDVLPIGGCPEVADLL